MTADDTEYKRGILTEADREYLQDPDEFKRQAAYTRRTKISQRVRRAVGDFPLLAAGLDDRTLEDLFAAEWETEELDDGGTRHENTGDALAVNLPHGTAFLIRARLAADPHPPAELDAEAAIEPFLRDIERGVEKWLRTSGLTGSVSASVSIEDVREIDAVAEDLADREEPLTGRERIERAAELGSAGYSTDEIIELLGEPEGSSEADDVDA